MSRNLILISLVVVVCSSLLFFLDSHAELIGLPVGPDSVRAVGGKDSSRPVRNENSLGTAISWSSDFPFPGQQAQILESGIGDVRGIVAGPNGDVYLSEANGDTLVYSDHEQKVTASSAARACAEEHCEEVDQRGIAFFGASLYIAEHGRGQIVKIDPKDLDQKIGASLDGSSEQVVGPSGLAAVGQTLFITDDRPWPATAEDSAYDSADYPRWLDKGTPRLFGALYSCTLDDKGDKCVGPPVKVATRLRHPSGVAARYATGPVYVAESDSNQVRWPIFRYSGGQWIPDGALGSVSAKGATLSGFLGVAIDEEGSYVFAAGPGGLYVFSTKGGGFGRVMFDEPVSGVAYYGGAVYLVVGRMLCRLRIYPNSPPKKPVEQRATASDVSSKPNEHNVSRVQPGLSPVNPPILSNPSHSTGSAVSPPQGVVAPPQGAVPAQQGAAPSHPPPSRPPNAAGGSVSPQQGVVTPPSGAVAPSSGAVKPPQAVVPAPQGAAPSHPPPSRPPKVAAPRKTRNCDCSGPG
jgi:hypothetical protein